MVARRGARPQTPIVIDIGSDRLGEFFDIQIKDDADLSVLDLQPRDRHLLLMVRRPPLQPGRKAANDKFLCGHDERHWFVAGIPEGASASTVASAKQSLQPDVVRQLERATPSRRVRRGGRKTANFLRQGEWFFIPAPEAAVNEKLALRNEPLSRGRGKPHRCELLYRWGGVTVYVCSRYPSGIEESERRELLLRNPEAAQWRWRVMRRNPVVYVRGRVTHPDHATIRLDGWHRVEMNTEHRSRAMASIAFLD